MARLDDIDPEDAPSLKPSAFVDEGSHSIPEPLRGYLGGRLYRLSWRTVGPGVRQFEVVPRTQGVATRLLRIASNTAIPHHGHRGNEHTLVLTGSYADEGGRYARGDVEIADQDFTHRPVSGPDEDCVCLVVTDAPLRFSGLLGRLMQPFVRF